MSVPTKPCATCGEPVADSALGRGAVENAAGRRYCSPCAAKLQNEGGPEAEAIKIVLPRPSSALIRALEEPLPPPAPPPPPPPAAPAPRKTATRRAAPRKEASRRNSVRKKASSKRAPARKGSSARTKPAPARKNSSKRTKPARREAPVDVGGDTGSTRRVSRRLSSKAVLPWYFNITRGQLMGIGGGAVGLVLLIVLICVLAGGDESARGTNMKRNPVPYGGDPSRAIEAAEKLLLQGKKQEAIKLLETAKQQAIRNGQDGLVQKINQRLYGLRFKTTAP